MRWRDDHIVPEFVRLHNEMVETKSTGVHDVVFEDVGDVSFGVATEIAGFTLYAVLRRNLVDLRERVRVLMPAMYDAVEAIVSESTNNDACHVQLDVISAHHDANLEPNDLWMCDEWDLEMGDVVVFARIIDSVS